ncbi:FAD-binding oxidoreductase [Castellaniella defragrans]|uniref:FAD/FMN-containing dehydrogenase n=1 Tax=Castellaniella defragrans TaxID=75697 RepID=A0A7W9WNL9_CASDE|nr:FAD-binding oxidoreductase [Castellaniella defragrans]KAB0609346.1 FAD-binding oxidoreductase [Castellaniella defragrans]MBB6083688.1 FAD/FMN-containing dehydrogenase [Castellaniella defragrans]
MANDVIEALRAAVGAAHCLAGDAIEDRYLRDWMVRTPPGRPLAVVRPADTAQVSAVLRACHAARVPVVPQGGRTGLAGGALPVPDCVVLCLERLDAIEEIDPAAATMTVGAGVPLETIQQAAQGAGFLFPLDLGARGSCRIGGNLSTNAGGNRVLRYGMARDLVLGLEAVLMDGTVLSGMNKMLKNNTGYDLKQLFIGSEGTLGVITRAVLRLFPQPRSRCTALCALTDYDAVVRLLNHARAGLGPHLAAFELMWPDFYQLVTSSLPSLPTPLPHGHGAYVLLESMGTDPRADQARFEAVLGEALMSDVVQNVVIAQSEAHVAALWSIRDASGELQRIFWPHAGYDVSIPTGDLGGFIQACTRAVKKRWPGARTVFFGHVGDSNIHIGVKVDEDPFPEPDIDRVVYGLVRDWGGSVSAEHGIGVLKRPYLGYSRSAAELAAMRALKAALDPLGLLNPGKVLPEPEG